MDGLSSVLPCVSDLSRSGRSSAGGDRLIRSFSVAIDTLRR